MLEIIIYTVVVAGAIHMGQSAVKSFIKEVSELSVASELEVRE